MELFLNPWYMVAGGAMVSSPILIHLINRMRFRRIRWAAMEFLLKSQKRNRRRLIIEQLILLLLRILLVLLAAFLVARFIGSALGLSQNASSTHVIILDDTVSMSDKWEDKKLGEVNSFDRAKDQLLALAKSASEKNEAHYFKVYLLSKPEAIFNKRINEQSRSELEKALIDLKPSTLHVPPNQGAQVGKDVLGAARESRRWLHFISDFREHDWVNGPNAEALRKSLDELAESGINISLVDAAHPERKAGQPPLHHDNFAIVGLRPEGQVAPQGRPVKVHVDIANFGNATPENIFLEVYIDDSKAMNLEHSKPINAPKPGQILKHTFEARFNEVGYHYITTKLQGLDQQTGITEDNTRYAVIEVREKVPVLLIDGAGEEGDRPGGDTRSVRNALEAAKGYEVISKGIEELDNPDLTKTYSTIFLLNVPKIESGKAGTPSAKRLQNLQEYVKAGGNITFFVGDAVDSTHYNKVLYEEAKGLFPVPLAKHKSDPLSEEQKLLRGLSLDPKMFVRMEHRDHQVLEGIRNEQNKFAFLYIDHYAPTRERFNWNPELSTPQQLKELITLPNTRPLGDYREQTQRLLDQVPQSVDDLKEQTKGLYDKLEKEAAAVAYENLFDRLEVHRKAIFKALEGQAHELSGLATALEAFLNDSGDPDEADRVDVTAFWDFSSMQDLKTRFQAFHDEVKYGYPLAVDRKYGEGHVVAVLTTAGSQWHDWPGNSPVSYTYPMFMVDLVRFLTSGGDIEEVYTGQELTFKKDQTRYENKYKVFAQAEETGAGEGEDEKEQAFIKADEKPGVKVKEDYSFEYTTNRRPGIYYFQFEKIRKEGEPKPPPEQEWVAYNLNTKAESDLRRAEKTELERNPKDAPAERGRIRLISGRKQVDGVLTRPQTDLSESPWLYLLFLLVLIAEQALAVHLSFHMRSSDVKPAAQGTTGAPTGTEASAA